MHRDDASPRYSEDIDIFHDASALVAANASADAIVLTAAGFELTWQTQAPAFRRAWVERNGQGLKIEWAYDSAFRFFPVQADPLFGYRLHDADVAVNKVLAGAGRLEIRDFIDLIHLHETYLPLGALAWAATGKDAGLSPLLILNELSRHAHYREEDLAEVRMREPVSLPQLKVRWLDLLRAAGRLVETLPATEVGCLYLDATGAPVAPDPAAPTFSRLTRHFGTLRGSWPRLSGAE